MGIEEKQALCAAEVTLNGERAVIMGARKPFAKVATLRSDGPVHEWAWPTVARIVASGGAFKS